MKNFSGKAAFVEKILRFAQDNSRAARDGSSVKIFVVYYNDDSLNFLLVTAYYDTG